MSLQVWLPLNGDLHNYGLSDVTVTNNGATVNTNGKIGKCYSFDGSNSCIELNAPSLYNIIKGGNQPFTIMFWIYHAAASRGIIFGDYGLTGTIQCNVELQSNHRVRFYWAGAPDKNFSTSVGENTWCHIALVYDGSQVIIYKNGVLQIGDSYSGTLTTKSKTTGVYHLGRDYRNETNLNGKINDVRIYDHALSAKEVEEIAKGLVLHYKLDNNINSIGWLLPNNISQIIRSSSGNTFLDFNYYSDLLANSETSYIVDFYAKGSVDAIKLDLYFRNSSGSAYAATNIQTLTTEWQHYRLALNGSPANLNLFRARCYSGTNGSIIYLSNVRLLSNNSPVRDTIIYDSSGYNNNGIPSNIFILLDSPRYDSSTKFNGSTSYIKVENNNWMAQGASNLTVNIWAYMDNWSNWNGHRLYSCTEGGGFNIENTIANSLTFPVCVYTNTAHSTTGYIPAQSRVAILKTDLTSGWHMLTYIYTETECQCYLDGILYQTKPYVSYGVYFNINGSRLFLGCEANGVNASGPYFTGQENDFRLYYTALTPEQIKELYNTSMSIDDNGNIHARELVEL